MIRFSPHVAVQVSNPKKAAEFYREHLGFTLVKDRDGEIQMTCGPLTFWFEEGAPAQGTFFEFAAEDFQGAYSKLVARGCAETGRYGDSSVVLRDPFGLSFHLFEEKNEFRATYNDTMIPAKNYSSLVAFYSDTGRFDTTESTTDYTLLTDRFTAQRLCITNGPSITAAGPGFQSNDLMKTLAAFEKSGAKITKRWENGPLRGANCFDPEGNEFMVWQTVPRR